MITMSHRNQWYIITSEELNDICSRLSHIEEEGPPECQKNARAVLDILALVRGRLT